MIQLTGKTALVAGVSRGIGCAIVRSLARAGAQVLVHYHGAEAAAGAVVDEVRAAGSNARSIAVDLHEPDGPHLLARRARAIIGDRLDILVANADVPAAATSLGETTAGDFDALWALNVRAPYFLVQQLSPTMCNGSSVVLLSPWAVHPAARPFAAYAASQGAVDTLIRQFAAVLGTRGIRVNAVAQRVA